MSEQALKSVASGTGTFAVLSDKLHEVQGGKSNPSSGKALPNVPAEAPEKTKPDLEKLARQLNLASQSIGRELRFRVDLQSGHSVIQVLDRETGEIIRQIPGEQAAASLHKGQISDIRLFDELV